MGIQPRDMERLTPYELYLMKEGYQERIEDDHENANFIAYTNYVSVFASQGISVVTYEEWLKPQQQIIAAETGQDNYDPRGRQISKEEKKRREALMNSIP
jgi:hypothetical protein